MPKNLPKILLTFRIGGENGGPYISHKRILESALTEKYDIQPFFIESPRKLRNPKVFFNTVNYIKNEKPDLVHLAGLGSEGFLVMLACRFARVKTVVAVHGSSTEAIGYGRISDLIFRLIESYTVKKANAVYGVSDYVSSWKIFRNAKNYCGTVYNIPDFSKTVSSAPHLRKELGIKNEDTVVVSTGRITTDKGFDTLSEVIKSLANYENIKFIIAGDGNYLNTLKSEIKKSGLEQRVYLLGYRDDIDDILKESDIFIICTKHETLCISLLEAANNSLPMIASDVGGIPEIISDKENGLLISPDDAEGFSKAILELYKNREERILMGHAAKKTVTDRFNAGIIVEKLKKIYSLAIGGRNVQRKQ